ncbi:unnamed protein product, partial [Mesorhabditis spiculigera]
MASMSSVKPISVQPGGLKRSEAKTDLKADPETDTLPAPDEPLTCLPNRRPAPRLASMFVLFFPPAAVYLGLGSYDVNVLINAALTLCGWVPGVAHALMVVCLRADQLFDPSGGVAELSATTGTSGTAGKSGGSRGYSTSK